MAQSVGKVARMRASLSLPPHDLLWCGQCRRPVVTRSSRMLLRIAAVGALAVALGLAGCGRKAGLDPPPGGALTDQSAANGNAVGPDGRPAPTPATPPPNRHTFLDWLID